MKLDTLNDKDRVRLVNWLDGSEPVDSKEDAVRLLCILQHIVSHNDVTTFPEAPADCICDEFTPAKFQHAGESLRFIIRATFKDITAQKKARLDA